MTENGCLFYESSNLRRCAMRGLKPKKAQKTWAFEVAGATGLEPATSGVTGRRSNQLNYRSAFSGAHARPSRANWQI